MTSSDVPPFDWPALLAQLQRTEDAVRRSRFLIRMLGVLAALLLALAIATAAQNVRLDHTVQQAARDRARIDRNVANIEAQRAAQREGICSESQTTVNAILALTQPPADLAQQWREQAQLDVFEHQLEQGLASFGCDLHLIPIPPPPPPPAAGGTGLGASHAITPARATPTQTRPDTRNLQLITPKEAAPPVTPDGGPITFVLAEQFTRETTAATAPTVDPTVGLIPPLCITRPTTPPRLRPHLPNGCSIVPAHRKSTAGAGQSNKSRKR